MNGLDDMYLFRSAVECGGLSPAARRLGLAKSTLARRINDLEARLGLHLYHRDSKRFALTNFGLECYEHCLRMAVEAEKVFALADRVRRQPAGVLHVICPPVIGAIIVDTLAVEFAASAPDVRLHLEETTGIYDPRNTLADLIIYPSFKALPDASLIARKILTSKYVLVVHPDLIEQSDSPAHPQDLKRFPCLGLGGRGADWHWTLSKGRQRQKHRFAPIFTTTLPSALLRAARHGLGVASLPEAMCREDLAGGNLTLLMRDWVPDPISFYAIYPSSKSLTAAARQFLDLLIERLPKFLDTS